MKFWVITDTHFGHKRLSEMEGRPKGFEEIILNNIKEMVSEDDILIHLGDFCFGRDNFWIDEFNLACKAKEKLLIKGNHDSRKKLNKFKKRGWSVFDHLRMTAFDLGGNEREIIFTHIPVIINRFEINIHGHLHTKNHHGLPLFENNCWVSIEHSNYEPILVDDLFRDSKKQLNPKYKAPAI